MYKSEFEIIRERKGPLFNDVRLQMLLKLEKEGYVDIHASGWKTTPRGDDFVNRFDRVLTPLVDEPLRFA